MTDEELFKFALKMVAQSTVDNIKRQLRAECATIKCVWYTGEASDVYFDVPMLMKNYPTTPVFVCTQRQVADALIMILNVTSLRGQW